MSKVKKIKKARIVAALVKRSVAIFVFDAKNRKKGNLLLDRCCCCLSPDLRKKRNAAAVMGTISILSLSKKDAAPGNGAVSFFVSTKSECFPQQLGTF